MDKFWVGTDTLWDSDANWALTSGGAGGAGIPTAADDVFLDGNGNAVLWIINPSVCNNMSLLAAATEFLLINSDLVINGDFSIAGGYFGITGGPGHVTDFKGNWIKTGGTFAIGTGTGLDPTCEFSGTAKTYANNDLGAASFQHVLISGTLTVSGTRLSQMEISQKLNITGELTVNQSSYSNICRVTLNGTYAGFGTFTGKLNGTGRLYWAYQATHSMIVSGIISIRYFQYALQTASATHILNTRQYESACTVEIEYREDAQICRFEAGRHYMLGALTIHGNHAGINTAELDWDTNTAEVWIGNQFNVYKNAFPSATFTFNMGDGTHIFRGSVDFYFSYASGTATVFVVNPGDGTMILWPKGIRREVIVP